MSTRPHIAIVGAGPVGLEAALAAAERGFSFALYEAGAEVAANVRSWGHVRMFTPWSMNVSPRMRAALERASRSLPAEDSLPSGAELVYHLLEPLCELPQVAPHLRFGHRVRAIARQGLLKHEEIAGAGRAAAPFRLLLADRHGGESVTTAAVVLDCTGTYGVPNSTGDGGIPAPGEKALDRRIVRFLPDVEKEADFWVGRTVLLVGSGHSAQTAARDFASFAERHPATRLLWTLRRTEPGFAHHARADPADPLPARAALEARARALVAGESAAVSVRLGTVVETLRREGERLVVTLRSDASCEEIAVDRVLSLTGGVGEHRLHRQLQVQESYAFAAPHKLAVALATGGSDGVYALTHPEPGFFILGSKSYGRNNSFLLPAGYAQVDEVFAHLSA